MSTKNNPSKTNPEVLKMYNSPIYRKKVKKMIEFVKNYRGAMTGTVVTRLPRRAKITKKNPTDVELEKFRTENKYKVDKETVFYFAQKLGADSDRSSRVQGRNDSAE